MTAQHPSYFKAGESVSIQSGVNGFIVYTDNGEYIAPDVNTMLTVVLRAITHHDEAVARARHQQAAQAQDTDDDEALHKQVAS